MPVVRVDEGMAERAIALGQRIGVVATLKTTLEPTSALIRRKAEAAGKTPILVDRICEGAFEALAAGNRERHDALVAKGISDVAAQVDVVVLAQASMARVVGDLPPGDRRVPVLSSPELAIARASDVIAEAATGRVGADEGAGRGASCG